MGLRGVEIHHTIGLGLAFVDPQVLAVGEDVVPPQAQTLTDPDSGKCQDEDVS
jgi:hypothetical protein